MPTVPPDQARPPEHELHQIRQAAESFGVDAERYDRTRPHYPQALVDRVVAESPGRDVLDVGCGTGIVARQFQAAGCRVLGIDPDARMAEAARQRGVDVEVSTIEAWDPAGRDFDAVVAGQAWHWVDPVTGAAKAARALRPGGRLALFWNAFQAPPDLAKAFAEVYQRALPNAPFEPRGVTSAAEAYLSMCAKAAAGMREAGGFGAPEQWRFDWDCTYSRDAWLDQLPTGGFLTKARPDTLAEVLAGVGAAIDAAGGSFTAQYATVTVTATRTGAA